MKPSQRKKPRPSPCINAILISIDYNHENINKIIHLFVVFAGQIYGDIASLLALLVSASYILVLGARSGEDTLRGYKC